MLVFQVKVGVYQCKGQIIFVFPMIFFHALQLGFIPCYSIISLIAFEFRLVCIYKT